VPNKVNPPPAPLVSIVDDDASMADSTRFLVHSFGFRAEAFLPAEEFLASELIGDASCLILILDLRMPGMDGPGTAAPLGKCQPPRSDHFYLCPSEGDRKQAIEKGAVDFLYKPFSEDALFKEIQLALSQRHDSK
jgi:FixJ family two-component response regulator